MAKPYTIRINNFGGILPINSAKLLPENMAQTAENCNLVEGNLKAVKDYDTSGNAQGTTIYNWHKDTGGTPEWLHWHEEVDVVKGPIADDELARIFYTGDTSLIGTGQDENGLDYTSVLAQDKDNNVRNIKCDIPSKVTVGTPAYIMEKYFTGAAAFTNFRCNQTLWVQKKTVNSSGKPTSESITAFTNLIPSTANYVKHSFDKGYLKIEFTGYSGFLSYSGTASEDTYYTVYGSTVQLNVPAYTVNGTNYVAKAIPTAVPGITSPKFSEEKYPLYMEDPEGGANKIFAEMQIVDVQGCDINYSKFVASGSSDVVTAPPSNIVVTLAMNYVGESVDRSVYYVQTIVDEWDVESPPSPISDLVTLRPGQYVALSALEGTADKPVRIYRSATGSNQDTDNFYFLSEETGATYNDFKKDSELAETLTIMENPPDDITGLVSGPNGLLAAFRDREVLFCEPYYPHSWPTEYRLTVDYIIKGIAFAGSDLVVLTEGNPFVISGSHPDSFTQVKLPYPQACISKRSICTYLDTVFYASPDGMMAVNGGGVSNITAKAFSKEDWAQFVPDIDPATGAYDTNQSLVAAVYDGKIYLFFNDTGDATRNCNVIIPVDQEIPNPALSTTEYAVKAMHYDLVEDVFYVVIGSAVKQWQKDSGNMTITWRSKRFSFDRPINFVALRVISPDYTGTIEIKIYSGEDETLEHTAEITGSEPFKIPTLFPNKIWTFEIVSDVDIDEFIISTSMRQIRNDS